MNRLLLPPADAGAWRAPAVSYRAQARRSPRPVAAAAPRASFGLAELDGWLVDRERWDLRATGGVSTILIRGSIDDAAANALLGRLSTAAKADAKAIFLDIDSLGGSASAARRMAAYVRGRTGPTVAFARRAHSGACVLALAADVVVADPGGGGLMLHAVAGGTPADREVTTELIAEHVWRRSALHPEPLLGMLSPRAGCDFTWPAWDALSAGLADDVGGLDSAMQIARDLAAGGSPVLTSRRLAILARSDSPFPMVKPC
jgi:ATP-dependent protease ClpP protease subunit